MRAIMHGEMQKVVALDHLGSVGAAGKWGFRQAPAVTGRAEGSHKYVKPSLRCLISL
jgi:hypothetical protein